MELGIIGLGKMGHNIGLNLRDKGYTVHGFDISSEARQQARGNQLTVHDTVADLVSALKKKIIWVMLPVGDITENMLNQLKDHLQSGDILIDGGNANFNDSVRRAKDFKELGIHYLDIGTSGGISGARDGACLMVGGEKAIFDQLEPLFLDLTGENAYLYAGGSGSGHFLKMVHNGVEYGMMQAIGEGFHLLSEREEYAFDLEAVARVWNNGSVIRGWLMELTENMFKESPRLEEYKDVVAASGEGQWTVETALQMNIGVPIIATSVMLRSMSQQEEVFSNKVLAGLRHQFGGHSFQKKI